MTPGSGSALSYGFDASGNLTTLPTGATGTYDKASELTSSAQSGTTTNYAYNADGEQQSATQGGSAISSATWNGATQLTAYSDPAADMTAATYDGNGLRASSTTTPSGGSAASQQYVWNTNPDVSQLLMDSANAYIYTSGSAPAEQVNLSTGTITYLVGDSLGSVRGTVSSSGALTGTTSYDAWGNPQTTGGLTATTPFGFAGGYTDPDGLIYLINRYYNPATGQFISADPDVSQTMLPYAYTAGDPVSSTDPDGLCPPSGCNPPKFKTLKSRERFAFFNFISAMGLRRKFKSAAIVGNLLFESGGTLLPGKWQSSANCNHHVEPCGRGIAQWTDPGSRWTALRRYARRYGSSAFNYEIQVDFVEHELITGDDGVASALPLLRAAGNLSRATFVVDKYYEQPQSPRESLVQRFDKACMILHRFGRIARCGPAPS
jgi:RHS repeat-associated protein